MDNETKDEIKQLIIETINSYNVTRFPKDKKLSPEQTENRVKVETSKQKFISAVAGDGVDGVFWITFKDGKFDTGEMAGLYSTDEALLRILRTWMISLLAEMSKE